MMRGWIRRWQAHCAGNVTTMFALGAPVLLFAVAVAVDFDLAATVKTRLDDAADAAALAALTPAMLQQSDAVAQAAAVAMFNARASALSTLAANQTQITATITHPNSNALLRQVTVSYSAQTNALFSNALSASDIRWRGLRPRWPPFPPTSISICCSTIRPRCRCRRPAPASPQMQSLTRKQDSGAGCAFACHQAEHQQRRHRRQPLLRRQRADAERRPILRLEERAGSSHHANRQLYARALEQYNLAARRTFERHFATHADRQHTIRTPACSRRRRNTDSPPMKWTCRGRWERPINR